MTKLRPLVESAVARGFPELNDVEINARYHSRIGEDFLRYGRHARHDYSIYVSSILESFSEDALIGGLAHELAHISVSVGMDDVLCVKDWKLCRRYGGYKTLDERATDLMVVRRGFARELLEFVKHAACIGKKYRKKDCLTQEELRVIVEELEK